MRKLELQAARLRLVIPTPEEANSVLTYYQENKLHLQPTDPIVPKNFLTLDFWQRQLEASIEQFEQDQSVRFFIEAQDQPGRLIGSTNFTQITRGPFQACFLGYGIHHEYQGKGYMFEALERAIQYIFEDRHLHRIMANYLAENLRSANILKRLGFRIDGQSPDYLFIRGTWRTHILTSLTNTKWLPREEDLELFNLGPVAALRDQKAQPSLP